MYKSMAFFKYNPNISVEECENHYREVHTQLVIDQVRDVPGFRAYVQNRVVSARAYVRNNPASVEIEPEFHRIVEMYWDAVPDLSRGRDRAFSDHPNFMDVTSPVSMTRYEVEEVIAYERDFPSR